MASDDKEINELIESIREGKRLIEAMETLVRAAETHLLERYGETAEEE